MARRAEGAKTGKARGTLSRETLLENALAIVDEAGLDALSLRALGKRIGVSYTALYRHLPDKNALLDGIAEQIWRETLTGIDDGGQGSAGASDDSDTGADDESGGTTANGTGDAGWRAHVRRYALRLHTTLLRHPNAAILVSTHPIDTLEQYQLLAEAIKPFMPAMAGENPPDDLLGLIQGATILTTGYVLAEAVAPFGDTRRDSSEPSDETREQAVRQSPELATLLAPLSDTAAPWSMQAEYRKALDALIDGWDGAARRSARD